MAFVFSVKNEVSTVFIATKTLSAEAPSDTKYFGQVFAIFVITIAAAEVGVGLAIVLLIFRNRRSANVDELNLMRW
jgi:NADH:ubiquinone oxidoreductase subunit K